MFLFGVAFALQPPLKEVEHPIYEDAQGELVRWKQIRKLAKNTDAFRAVRKKKRGRTVVRVLFTGAAIAEGLAANQLRVMGSHYSVVVGLYGVTTGVGAGALWGTIPQNQRENRALILNATNALLKQEAERSGR